MQAEKDSSFLRRLATRNLTMFQKTYEQHKMDFFPLGWEGHREEKADLGRLGGLSVNRVHDVKFTNNQLKIILKYCVYI